MSQLERFDKFCFEYRNVLAAAPLLVALVLERGMWGRPAAAWAIGGVLAVAGVKLRALCVCYNKYAQREKKSLATGGPYGVVRNPLYVGNALVIFGATVASQHLWMLPIMALWCAGVYSRVAAHEERRLVARYRDDYLAYRDAVPAWFPRPPEGFFPSLVRQSASLVLLVPFLLKLLLGR